MTVVLGTRGAEGVWNAALVSANHNGREADEVARVRAEHPDEPECILEDRILGGIAVTRGTSPPCVTRSLSKSRL